MKRITITGNVGADPEFSIDCRGRRFAAFRIALKVYKQTKPEWIYITCCDSEAEFVVKYIHQGAKVLIDGVPSVDVHINRHGEAIANQRVFAKYLELIAAKPRVESNSGYDNDVID